MDNETCPFYLYLTISGIEMPKFADEKEFVENVGRNRTAKAEVREKFLQEPEPPKNNKTTRRRK